jgi:glucose-1-phosphate cytidylyltransferase
MKVVLFCGGFGTRLRDYSDHIPKPMVHLGSRPILWQLMKYYAHYGHKEFILCLGYKSNDIKSFFLDYNECISNNFILSDGGKKLSLFNRDIDDWSITFVDTGVNSNIGQRLTLVQGYLNKDEIFLANYADGLTNLPFPKYLDYFKKRNKIASFISITPNQSVHIISTKGDTVKRIKSIKQSRVRVNGGFFIFRKEIFDYIKDGEDLVNEPFQRLINDEQLITYKYDGFWACMDTFKDKQDLDEMIMRGETPWVIWNSDRSAH